MLTFGASCADSLLPMSAKFSPLEHTHDIRLLAKFSLSRSVYSVALWRRKTPILPVFWTLAFSGVANWHQSYKVERWCTTTNLPLSNGIKIVSVVQRLHGEITISDVQKRDRQINRQANKQTRNRRAAAKPAACAKP